MNDSVKIWIDRAESSYKPGIMDNIDPTELIRKWVNETISTYQ